MSHKEGGGEDEGIDELVERVMKLGVSDPQYLVAQVKLVQKAPAVGRYSNTQNCGGSQNSYRLRCYRHRDKHHDGMMEGDVEIQGRGKG